MTQTPAKHSSNDKVYCLGIIFDKDLDTVMLIKRSRGPHYGKWNAIGGHQEPGESPWVAIARECLEETEIITTPSEWLLIGHVNGNGWVMDVLSTVLYSRAVPKLEHIKNDEFDEIKRVKIADITKLECADYLTALIHLALERHKNKLTSIISSIQIA